MHASFSELDYVATQAVAGHDRYLAEGDAVMLWVALQSPAKR